MKRKFFADNVSDEFLKRFPDTTDANIFFELAQQMLDTEVMTKKDIETNLKTLYGATDEQIENIRERLFNKDASVEADDHYADEVYAAEDNTAEGAVSAVLMSWGIAGYRDISQLTDAIISKLREKGFIQDSLTQAIKEDTSL